MGRRNRQYPLGIVTSNGGHSSVGHIHVIGRTRSGKSKAIEGWILQVIKSGIGVGVIDPHGDLFTHLISYLALASNKYPDLARRTVIINPLDEDWCVGFNPLQLWPGEVPERKAMFLADLITQIFHDDPTIVVRMRRVMRYTFQALMELNLTLIEVPRFLVDRDFRESVIDQVYSPNLIDFWRYGFPSKERDANEWISSTLNRLEPLVQDPDFRLIFGQKESTINFRSIMDTGSILLVNTSKGELMDENSRLLGAFVVGQLQQSAMTRTDLSDSNRKLFWLVLDEFQTYVSPAISTLLEETGKYKMSLLMAHQHLGQLRNEELRAAVLSQCSDMICFGIGEEDAKVFAPKMFRPNQNQTKHIVIKPANWGKDVILPYEDITWLSLSEIWELEERKLFDLKPRYFWHKKRGYKTKLYRSFDLPNITIPDSVKKKLLNLSGRRFAHSKGEAYRRVNEDRKKELDQLTRTINVCETDKYEDFDVDDQFWSK